MLPTDLALLRTPSDPSLTPDGSSVAVAVTRPDLDADEYRGEIWVVPTDGSAAPRRFTRGPRDTRPRYSPDGRWLAFLRAEQGGKPQLHVMPADGGEPRRVSEHPLGARDPAWSPDSTRIAYLAPVPEAGRYGTDPGVGPEAEPPRRITTLQYRLDDVGFTFDRRAHVFMVDALDERAEPVQVTDGDADDGSPAWSPDGRTIAFASARHATRDRDVASDVFVVPATGGTPRRLTDTRGPVGRPAFAPDGRQVVFAGIGTLDAVCRNTGVWSVPVDGSAPPRRWTDAERWDVEPFGAASRLPLLTDDGVTTPLLRRGAVELVRFGPDGEPEVLVGGRRWVDGYDRAAGVLAAVVRDGTSAGEVVVVAGGGERTLTDFGAPLRDRLRAPEERTVAGPDGYPAHGWVVKPAGEGPFPVLLMIHGGPFTQYGWSLSDEAQVYAGAGYAVVMANPRGSAGYGEAHGRALVGRLGGPDHADLLAFLDGALADPDLDGDRVGVLGGSYGGFTTTWLLASTDRFAAGISERAVNAWDSFTGSSDIGWYFTDALAGTDPERVAAQSPLAHAGGIRAPCLIIHAEQDWRCPVEQAQRLFVTLKRAGVETELLLFPGEGHELSRSGRPRHRLARFEAILDWWARHLGTGPA